MRFQPRKRITRVRKGPYQGAGLLVVCPDRQGEEHQVLLARRAIRPDNETWSLFGGKKEALESFAECALREASEEGFGRRAVGAALSGYLSGPLAPEALPEHRSYFVPGIVDWRTYLLEVARPFPDACIQLNWENSEAGWFSVKALPDPVHRGVLASLHHFGMRRTRS